MRFVFLNISSSDRERRLSELFIMAQRVGSDIRARHTSERIMTRLSVEKTPKISEVIKKAENGTVVRKRLPNAFEP